MTAPFSKIVNTRHDNLVLVEQQNQAIKLANSQRVKTPAKKKAGWLPEIILAAIFVVGMFAAFYVANRDHLAGPLNYNGTPMSEMSISEQLKLVEEARYND